MYHLVRDGQPLPQEGSDDFHDGLVEFRESLQLLAGNLGLARASEGEKKKLTRLTTPVYLRAIIAAVLDDPLHLFVDQLHAAQAGLLQAFDLLLHQQLEGDLGHEQRGARALMRHGGGERSAIGSGNLFFFLNDNKTKLTVAFRMAVRISMVLRPPKGSTHSNVRPKVSWNM